MQLLDDVANTNPVRVGQRSLVNGRPAESEDGAAIRVVGRRDHALGQAMTDFIDHLPNGADGDLKRRRASTDRPADQAVDSSVNLRSPLIQVEALRTFTTTVLVADMPRLQYRPEAFDVHHPLPEVSRDRLMDSPEFLETDSVK